MADITAPTLPGSQHGDGEPRALLRGRRGPRRERLNGDLPASRPPFSGAQFLRLAMSLLLGVLAMFTLGGGLLILLLWQEDRASGVLSNQIDRAWDLFANLQRVESIVALAVVPLAVAWAGLATLNVRRATARRCNPLVPALAIPAAIAGVWAVGAGVVEPADDWMTATGGLILQAVILAVPVLALERVARATDGARRPLRLTYLSAVAFIVVTQGLGSLSTIARTDDPEQWGRLAAYLIMAALIQILGAIAVNEACRSIESATAHRFGLRKAFGENVLLNAGMSSPMVG